MLTEVLVVGDRIEQAQNMLARSFVEVIRKRSVGGSPVLGEFDLGIIDDNVARFLDAKLAADLHRD
jgi:hypothetical protein